MELVFNTMIEGVVLAVEARSRAPTEEGCNRVFLISALSIYIGANSHGTYIPDDALYYLAGQPPYPSPKKRRGPIQQKENKYDNLVVDVFI